MLLNGSCLDLLVHPLRMSMLELGLLHVRQQKAMVIDIGKWVRIFWILVG